MPDTPPAKRAPRAHPQLYPKAGTKDAPTFTCVAVNGNAVWVGGFLRLTDDLCAPPASALFLSHSSPALAPALPSSSRAPPPTSHQRNPSSPLRAPSHPSPVPVPAVDPGLGGYTAAKGVAYTLLVALDGCVLAPFIVSPLAAYSLPFNASPAPPQLPSCRPRVSCPLASLTHLTSPTPTHACPHPLPKPKRRNFNPVPVAALPPGFALEAKFGNTLPSNAAVNYRDIYGITWDSASHGWIYGSGFIMARTRPRTRSPLWCRLQSKLCKGPPPLTPRRPARARLQGTTDRGVTWHYETPTDLVTSMALVRPQAPCPPRRAAQSPRFLLSPGFPLTDGGARPGR